MEAAIAASAAAAANVSVAAQGPRLWLPLMALFAGAQGDIEVASAGALLALRLNWLPGNCCCQIGKCPVGQRLHLE